MITRSVVATAADQTNGMTLDELARFVQEALRAEVDASTVVRVRANLRGGIKRLETKA